MKKIFIPILLLIAVVSGCKKNDPADNPLTESVKPATGTSTSAIKPRVDFNITNLLASGNVLEGRNLRFQVQSYNAVSYSWDFGNGIKFDGRTPPADIYYVPCGGSYTITLTTKSSTGDIAVASKSFVVMCSGKNHGLHLTDTE